MSGLRVALLGCAVFGLLAIGAEQAGGAGAKLNESGSFESGDEADRGRDISEVDAFLGARRSSRIAQVIPTVTYPRVIKRVGKSPPQYAEE